MASLVISCLRPARASLIQRSFVSARQPQQPRLRAMATTVPQKFQFLVYAPDKTDEGAFQRRLSVRPEHLANAQTLTESGVMKLGRPFMTPESLGPGADQKLIGSVMFFEAANIDDVRKLIENDIYYKSDVWDPERLVITPLGGALI